MNKNIKTRCEDCVNLKLVKGVWTCTECFGQHCEDIDDCPEGITAEEVTTIQQTAKENKVKLVARSDEKKERKPRERKPDIEKEDFVKRLAEFCETCTENVKITNVSKIIEFDIGENHYKIDLIRTRNKKK